MKHWDEQELTHIKKLLEHKPLVQMTILRDEGDTEEGEHRLALIYLVAHHMTLEVTYHPTMIVCVFTNGKPQFDMFAEIVAVNNGRRCVMIPRGGSCDLATGLEA